MRAPSSNAKAVEDARRSGRRDSGDAGSTPAGATAEKLLRFTVEQVDEPGVLALTSAKELWKVYLDGEPAHYIALDDTHAACCSDHPKLYGNGCQAAVDAVYAVRSGLGLEYLK